MVTRLRFATFLVCFSKHIEICLSGLYRIAVSNISSAMRISILNRVRVSLPQFLALPKHHFAHSANIISLSGYIICLQGQHHSALFERCRFKPPALQLLCRAVTSKKTKAKLEMKGQVKYGYKPLTDLRNYHKK